MSTSLATYFLLLCVLHATFLFKSSYAEQNAENQSCVTPDGTNGSCKDVIECEPILNLFTTFKRSIPMILHQELNAYRCDDGQKVCCPSGPIFLRSQIIYHNREVPPDVSNHKNYHLIPEECGYLDSSTRITHGHDAALNEFPWMALLQYRTPHGLKFLCGGTIINPRYILTAGHCLGTKNKELVSVRVGEHNVKNLTDCEVQNDFRIKCNPSVQDLKVEEIILHHQFKESTEEILNDIALLRVSKISEAENVFPICLPVGEVSDVRARSGYITGWGLTSYEKGQRSDILQKVGVPLTDKKSCAAIYSEHRIELTKTQVCAGGTDGKAFCAGDSGGPLQVAAFKIDRIVYVQHGIISRAPRYCETPGYPGVYTGVKFYMDWILDNMKP